MKWMVGKRKVVSDTETLMQSGGSGLLVKSTEFLITWNLRRRSHENVSLLSCALAETCGVLLTFQLVSGRSQADLD